MKALVPNNHRLREHALAEVLAPLKAINPVSIETVWDAWRCPDVLLPFLAYAVSVDFWDDGWDEVKKRQAIAASPAYHRRKGTRRAVDDAATYTGRDVMIAEWHQFVPHQRRATFRVTLELHDDESAIPTAETVLLRRLVTRAKPKSRAYSLEIARVIGVATSVSLGLAPHPRITLAVPPAGLAIALTPTVSLRIDSSTTLEAA